jgi:hypothetical protein
MRKGFSSHDEYTAHLLLEEEQDKAKVLSYQRQMREQRKSKLGMVGATIFLVGLFLVGVIGFYLLLESLHF